MNNRSDLGSDTLTNPVLVCDTAFDQLVDVTSECKADRSVSSGSTTCSKGNFCCIEVDNQPDSDWFLSRYSNSANC